MIQKLIFKAICKLQIAFFIFASLSVQAGHSEEEIDLLKKNIRQYVLFNYRPLSLDIILGEGIYLNSLNYIITEKYCSIDQLPIDSLKYQLTLINYIPDYARFVANLAESVVLNCKTEQ